MIPLGLFLGYLVATVVAAAFSWWLMSWLLGVSIAVAVVAVIAVLVAVAAVFVLLAERLAGLVAAAAVILFWCFVIFGADVATGMFVLAPTGALLFIGLLVAVVRRLERVRPASEPSAPPQVAEQRLPTTRQIAKERLPITRARRTS
jgi:hypothetical protein